MSDPVPVNDSDLSYPGEPGVEVDACPPFIAEHDVTRWLFALNRKGVRPGLKRIRGLLADLGHPERDLKTIVTAGTNGKGSTTRILARLLQDCGLKVACYTSPHLLRVYERLTIDDKPVDPSLFHAMAQDLQTSVSRHEASWFETLTATAVAIAREQDVDVLCCETGLGGRLDASNALPAMATLLTGVSLDHQHILGSTRTEIAAEKLGLLKDGVPFFTAVDDELRGQAFAAAVAAGAPAHFLDELTRCEADGEHWRFTSRSLTLRELPRLGGAPMQQNAALALLTLEELADRGVLPFPEDVAGSLGRVFLPGRYQQILRGPAWLVDTAHNREALTNVLDQFTAGECSGRRHLLFGGLRDKDPGRELAAGIDRCDTVTLAPIALPRSRNRSELESLMDLWGVSRDTDHVVCGDLGEALARLAGITAANDQVLVTGSCFLVAEVLWRLGYRDLEETRDKHEAATLPSLCGEDRG